MALPDLSLRRPVATAMLYLGIAVLGAVSFLRLPIDLLPEVSFPTLAVWTVYPDAGPEEVERFVTERVEGELARVPGARSVSSRSREGQSLVRVRFAWGTDMEHATLLVRERLDNLREGLPRSAERPVILRSDPASDPILTLAAAGPDLRDVRDLAEAVFKRRLEQLDGVALAAVTGGPRREIRVELDPERLAVHGLTVERVAEALDRANYHAPGGQIRRGRYHYSLRTLGQFERVAQLGGVVVDRPEGGGPVLLRDVASIRDTLAEAETAARYNGEPAVGLQIYKEAGSNTVRVADRVERVLEELRADYPAVRLEVAASQAGFIREAIANVVQALLLGGVLAFLVLFLFLRDPRYPVAVGLAIPISVMAAFALLYLFDVSLNIMSLGGLALGVGLLVDNSIVVLENVFRHHEEEGRAPREAASMGAREVAGAIAASTLTTIAVFGPVLYVDGVAGALFGHLSLAVTFSLLASLLVALTLLPLLAARAAARGRGAAATDGTGESPSRAGEGSTEGRAWSDGGGGGRLRRPLDAFDRGFRRFAARYERALAWSLAHRGQVLGIAVAALVFALFLGRGLPRGLMPAVDEGQFRVELELASGTPLAVTDSLARAMEAVLLPLEGVEGVFARVGRARGAELAARELTGLNSAALEVRLAAGSPPGREVVERFRAGLAAAGVDPSRVAVRTGQATALGRVLALGDADLAVRLQGSDLDGLVRTAEAAAARLRALPELADVRVDFQRDQPVLEVEVDADAAARHGLTVREVADAIEGYLRGRLTDRPYVEFADRVEIRVGLAEAGRERLDDVLRLRVKGVPMRTLVRARETRGPVEVRREEQSRTVQVLADVRRGGLGGAVAAAEASLAGLELPPRTALRVAGENEEMRASFRSLLFAFGLALFLVYLIMAAKFESLIQPAVVLVSVPLAGIGAVVALWLAGAGLDAMSGIGIVILIGIVVNDAILKVDFINQHRAAGHEKRTAILEAGRLRLRPIVMTTATTVVGLLPLAVGWGAGADLRAPLAVAVIGGLLSATFLTLIVVPVVYSLLVDPGVSVAEEPEPVAGTHGRGLARGLPEPAGVKGRAP